MLNLASLRYREVLAAEGGPIVRIESCQFVSAGRLGFASNAWLRGYLTNKKPSHFVYGAASGSGVDDSPMIARFKAISEAMERWAHMAVLTSDRRRQFGFDVDPSSNGMAAFPGLFARQARPAALMEAAERFNLLNWWEGRLDARVCDTRWPGVSAVVPQSEAPGVTVILFRHGSSGHYAYGHAAAGDFEAACDRAAQEMERHEQVVNRYALAHAGTHGTEELPAEAHILERRALFFSTPAGHEVFLHRLATRPVSSHARPRVVFDGVIPGPWSRYADVWRVAYEPPSRRFIGREVDYFFL
jgi:ribosomal protein S12 methylthiotransferase accessory factor YcaO